MHDIQGGRPSIRILQPGDEAALEAFPLLRSSLKMIGSFQSH